MSLRVGGRGGWVRWSSPIRVGLIASLFIFTLVCFAEIASSQPPDPEALVIRGMLAYDEQRYEEALTLLRQALELDPANTDALYYTGLIQIALGRLAEAAEALAKVRVQDPENEALLFQLGVVYFSLQAYEEAQPLLEKVFARNPKLESLGYYVGFMRYRQKDYQGALRAFRAGVSADPNIQQLTQFYTGLALGILGLPERAAAEIEQAIKLQPASPLTGPAERLREAVVTARERERRFRVEARLGVFYDDNVPVIPRKSDDSLAQSQRQRNHESSGAIGALRLDYSFLRVGSLEATATYSFFTTYNTALPDFNIVNHLGSLGATYRGTVGVLPYQLALQYTYDYLTLDEDEFVQRQTVTPGFTLAENATNLTALQLRYQRKEFSNDTTSSREEKRDGANWMAGFTHLLRFEGDKHLLKLGYQWDIDDTKGPNDRGRNFAYIGQRVLAGGQYTLPWAGIRLKYDFDVHLRNYRHANTVLPTEAPGTKERFDAEYTHIFGFSLPLPNALTRALPEGSSLTLSVDYQRTDARSNLKAFDFMRNVISIFLAWSS